MNKKMRIPTDKEYDKLVEVTGGNDEKMHWKDMFSHVDDTENEYNLSATLRAYRGYYSARTWYSHSASNRNVFLGFRPAVDLNPASLPSDIKEGDTLVIGTLYMNGTPVPVPENPVFDGDIEDFVLEASLELRVALKDPKYQMTGIYIGDGVVVADRVMLKYISYLDSKHSIAVSNECLEPDPGIHQVFVHITGDGLIRVISNDKDTRVVLIDEETEDEDKLTEADAMLEELEPKIDAGELFCVMDI